MHEQLRRRAIAAIAAYRADQDLRHLDVLTQDGHRRIAHCLVMEGLSLDQEAAPYTAEIEEFLRR